MAGQRINRVKGTQVGQCYLPVALVLHLLHIRRDRIYLPKLLCKVIKLVVIIIHGLAILFLSKQLLDNIINLIDVVFSIEISQKTL